MMTLQCEAHDCVLLFCTVTDYTVHEVSKLKPSFQVSTYDNQHPASHANDGNGQTCAASKPETNPWWSVDLEGPTFVFMVKLTNSGDDKGKTWMYTSLITFSQIDSNRCFLHSFSALRLS